MLDNDKYHIIGGLENLSKELMAEHEDLRSITSIHVKSHIWFYVHIILSAVESVSQISVVTDQLAEPNL